MSDVHCNPTHVVRCPLQPQARGQMDIATPSTWPDVHYFIDYEFSGNNYIGMDIAIHIYGFDLTNPLTESFQEKKIIFLETYLQRKAKIEEINIINYFDFYY